jgi:hypothetical protein
MSLSYLKLTLHPQSLELCHLFNTRSLVTMSDLTVFLLIYGDICRYMVDRCVHVRIKLNNG